MNEKCLCTISALEKTDSVYLIFENEKPTTAFFLVSITSERI